MSRLKSISKTFVSQSSTETVALGKRLGKKLKIGDVVLFVAHLGAGKTTFSQGVIQGLGLRARALSPTFILAQSFSGKTPVHHLDFYRVTPKELLEIGIEDYFTGLGQIKRGVVLIEWADRFKKIWPTERLEVRIKTFKTPTQRAIAFKAVGPRYRSLLKSL